MNALRVVVRDYPNGNVLEVQGDVDLGSVDALQARLQDLLSRPSQIVEIDLHLVDFLDSSGVSMLLRQFRAYYAANKFLRRTRASRNIRRTFSLSAAEHRTSFDSQTSHQPDPRTVSPLSARLLRVASGGLGDDQRTPRDHRPVNMWMGVEGGG